MLAIIRIDFPLSDVETISEIGVTKNDARLAAAEILAKIRDHLDLAGQATFLQTLAQECERFAGDRVDRFLSGVASGSLAGNAASEPHP